MARFPFAAVALVALLPAAASAVPYELAPGSRTNLYIYVTASDGSTTETVIAAAPKAIDYGGASSEAFVDVADFLRSALFVRNLDVHYGPMTFAGALGGGAIPVSITFDSVSLSYSNSMGTLNYIGAPRYGGALIAADVLSGSLAGALSGGGSDPWSVPFSFSGEDFCAEWFGCWPPTNPADPDAPVVGVMDDFDRFTLHGDLMNTLLDREAIAEIGGITYRLELLSSLEGSMLQVVPEPGTGALLGLGLFLFGLRQRV